MNSRSTAATLIRLAAVSGCFVVLLTGSAVSSPQESPLTGRWEWRGPAGFQRLVLNLKESRGKLTGDLLFGPGPGGGSDPETYWEFFFDPARFSIRNGTYKNGEVRFEYRIVGNREVYDNLIRAGYSLGMYGGIRRDDLKFTFAGRLDGDRLLLTRESRQRSDVQLEYRNQEITVVLRRSDSPLLHSEEQAASQKRGARVPSQIRFSVRDSNGEWTDKLAPRDVIVTQGDRNLEVGRLTPADAEWSVALVYDAIAFLLTPYSQTGTLPRGMEGARELWENIGTAATKFVADLRPRDRMTMFTFFNERVETLMGWRNGREPRSTTLRPLEFSLAGVGYPDLYTAIRQVSQRLRAIGGHKVAVLFTDGTDGRSLWGYVNDESGRHVLDPLSGLINDAEEEEFESLLRDVGESGVSFYVVLLSGSQRPPYFDNVPGVQEALSDHAALLESRMTALAEASGGRVIYRGDLLGAASFPSVLAETLGIGKTHSLSIEPSGEVANPEPVRLRLRQDGWEVRIR